MSGLQRRRLPGPGTQQSVQDRRGDCAAARAANTAGQESGQEEQQPDTDSLPALYLQVNTVLPLSVHHLSFLSFLQNWPPVSRPLELPVYSRHPCVQGQLKYLY